MKIEIRNKRKMENNKLKEHAYEKALAKFDRFKGYITSVTIRIEDLNGPKGGVDKNCRVEINGTFGTKVIECRDIDYFAVVDRTLETAEHSIRRLVEQKVVKSKRPRQTISTVG